MIAPTLVTTPGVTDVGGAAVGATEHALRYSDVNVQEGDRTEKNSLSTRAGG